MFYPVNVGLPACISRTSGRAVHLDFFAYIVLSLSAHRYSQWSSSTLNLHPSTSTPPLCKQGACFIRHLPLLAKEQFAHAGRATCIQSPAISHQRRCSLHQRPKKLLRPAVAFLATSVVEANPTRSSTAHATHQPPGYHAVVSIKFNDCLLPRPSPQITGRGRPPSLVPYMQPDHTLPTHAPIYQPHQEDLGTTASVLGSGHSDMGVLGSQSTVRYVSY